MAEKTRLHAFCTLLRNLVFAGLVYSLIFGVAEVLRNPNVGAKGKLGIPAMLDKTGPTELIKTTRTGVQVKFASSSTKVTINPHANVFNRPVSAVELHDDYLGERPHVDTEADLELMVEACRGTYEGIEKMRNVFDCLQYLANEESQYYRLPAKESRASAQDPHEAEYNGADGGNNTLDRYPSYQAPKKHSIGSCPGPITPYHTYWTGPATWRVEAFIKSYLYTQNLACSRLYIWLDADHNPNAVHNMMEKDALFARFLPLVDRGDIILKAWNFPTRIPLPSKEDNTDGRGYYKTPGKPNKDGEYSVADGLVRDKSGQEWLVLTQKQMTFLPVAVSDAMRFVVLHLYGGSYYDMDVLMLRDMRPLVLPSNHSFAERWAAHPHPGDYNTAIMSLTANSSLSSYLLRGGVRMGLNFHPRVIGRMAWKDGRDREFLMLETAAFDPIWTEFNWDREGRCTVPCLRDYGAAFKGKEGALRDEWESFDGPQLKKLNLSLPENQALQLRQSRVVNITTLEKRAHEDEVSASSQEQKPGGEDPSESFSATPDEEDDLRSNGVVLDYHLEEDKFPPNNRTLQNFFRGAWTYHIHNQWMKHPEPGSWLAVLEAAHDGFFAGKRTNPYGETWDGPYLQPYNYWPEFV